MERFSTNANQYTEQFSREFEKQFMDCLQRHHVKRVAANYVYNEMIQNKSHVHMNSTKFDSLGTFVRYLGEQGKCEVEFDETDEKWYLRWIDPVLEQRKAAEEKKAQEQAKRQKRMSETLIRQVEELNQVEEEDVLQELETTNKMVIKSIAAVPATIAKQKLAIFKEEEESAAATEAKQEQEEVQRGWLHPEIIVRICSKKVAGAALVNEKAVVSDVFENGNVADLIVLKTGQELLGVESKRLETVVPKLGGKVMVCNPQSAIRGSTGRIASLVDKNTCGIQFETGTVVTLRMEDVCKLFDQEE